MERPRLYFITAAELEPMGRGALDQLVAWRTASRDDDDLDATSEERPPEAALWALRFFAVAAGDLGDPSLLPLLGSIALELTQHDDDYVDGFEPVEAALTALVATAASAEAVAHLASHEDERVRAAMARGLRTDTPDGRALLEDLADDATTKVRNAARASLAKVTGVAWWRGIFRHDPTAGLDAAEVASVKPAIEALMTIFEDDDGAPAERLDEVRALVAKLPDRPARELGDTVLRSATYFSPDLTPLFVDLTRRPGATAYLLHVLDVLDHEHHAAAAGVLAPMMAAVPDAERQGACDALVDFAFARSREEWDEHRTPSAIAAAAAAAGWTARGDVDRLLDRLLAEDRAAEPFPGATFRALASVLTGPHADLTRVLPRVIDAVERGCPGPWCSMRLECAALLDAAPAETRRAVAMKCLALADADAVHRAVEALLGPLHERARDGTRLQHAAALAGDPPVRRAMLSHHGYARFALPTFRAALRAGELGVYEAASVMSAIDELYGGFSNIGIGDYQFFYNAKGETPEGLLSRRPDDFAKQRARYAPFLGAKTWRGPPTEAEWRRWRATRDHAMASGRLREKLDDVLAVLPPGPIRPEDRPLVEHVMAAWRETAAPRLTHFVPMAFTQHPDPWLLRFLDEFASVGDALARKGARECRLDMRRRLGLPPLEPKAPAGEASADAEWMDQDD